ncbi:MAG: Endonuclease/exonuclease/phosphatase [Benjaminiella poitrasii]|nr:MAG: Endonuclease/exonuclease/phosphatase [Benjaminiella poitrasii]
MVLASPPLVIKKQSNCQFFTTCFNKRQPHFVVTRRQFCYCFPSKKACIGVYVLVTLLPLISFIVLSAIYFSPVSLPSPKTTLPLSSSPRLLTFNLFMRPPGIKNNKDDYKTERLDYIIQHVLPSYDIIAFQEAFAYANRRIDHLLRAAYDQGLVYHLASPRHYPWDLGGDGGLLTLSRYPIVKANRIEFPRGVHADWLSFKGALHALIEIDSKHLVHLYTTHTQASYDNGGELNMDDTKVRLSQFARVHQFMAETSKYDNYPILLMGDLNVNAAVHDGFSPDVHSYNSSLAYTMMMDVLRGKGTNLELINNIKNTTTIELDHTDIILLYNSSWRLDNLTDIVYERFGYHPVTFGDYKRLSNGTLIPAEVTLTSHNQLLTVQSIDRLLWAGYRGSNNTSITIRNISVEHFFVEKNDTTSLPFTQLSGMCI